MRKMEQARLKKEPQSSCLLPNLCVFENALATAEDEMDKRIFAFADTESVLAFVKMTITAALYFLCQRWG